jgi:hypothetical protein
MIATETPAISADEPVISTRSEKDRHEEALALGRRGGPGKWPATATATATTTATETTTATATTTETATTTAMGTGAVSRPRRRAGEWRRCVTCDRRFL